MEKQLFISSLVFLNSFLHVVKKNIGQFQDKLHTHITNVKIPDISKSYRKLQFQGTFCNKFTKYFSIFNKFNVGLCARKSLTKTFQLNANNHICPVTNSSLHLLMNLFFQLL